MEIFSNVAVREETVRRSKGGAGRLITASLMKGKNFHMISVLLLAGAAVLQAGCIDCDGGAAAGGGRIDLWAAGRCFAPEDAAPAVFCLLPLLIAALFCWSGRERRDKKSRRFPHEPAATG